MTGGAPTLPKRTRVRCAWCNMRRMCWPLRVRGTGITIPTCDDCLFDMKAEGAFDAQ